MKKFALLLVVVFAFWGCAVAYGPRGSAKINNIKLGMTKTQVIEVMGEPVSISVMEGVEYLNYNLIEALGATLPYFVRLKDGKVDAYGRYGDFDSTKKPY